MSGLLQHARARRIPTAVLTAATVIWGLWAIWTAIASPSVIPAPLSIAATGFAAIAAGTTLTGPDAHLDQTAALRWPPRRALHLAVATIIILALLLSVADTRHGYGNVAMLLRNCAGSLGLISLGAATLGGARAWFYLIPWISIPPFLPYSRDTADSTLAQILTWPLQPVESTAATTVAVTVAALGAISYILKGSRPITSSHTSLAA